MKEYSQLKLSNQLCFPLYVVSKEVIKIYKPYLEQINLTYTQYITMLVLWEHNKMNVKHIGDNLYLDSGTLTSVLKQLEIKGYIIRTRNQNDSRNLTISITEKGEALKEKVKDIPNSVANCVNLSEEESAELYKILYKIIDAFSKK